MNSLEVKISSQTSFTLNQDYPAYITYPISVGGRLGEHQIELALKAGDVLEIYSKCNGESVSPILKEESTPLSLTEQLSKLPFKEQNALYKLMNTWGCWMERA